MADETPIGPLTAEEWCSLRLGTDDDPFQCCGDTSDLRDAAFHALLMGGAECYGTEFHAVWLRVTETHPGHTLAEDPVVGKLYRFYVEGKEPPPSDEELDAWIGDQRIQTQRAVTREVFDRSGEGYSGDSQAALDALLDGHLAEIADKAAGSFRREHEALFTGKPVPNVQHATLNHLLTVVSALRLVLGFEPTPIATDIVAQLRAERSAREVA